MEIMKKVFKNDLKVKKNVLLNFAKHIEKCLQKGESTNNVMLSEIINGFICNNIIDYNNVES